MIHAVKLNSLVLNNLKFTGSEICLVRQLLENESIESHSMIQL